MADSPAKESKTTTAPVLPLRDIVVFPHMIVPLFVGREKSVRALEEVINDEKQILLLTQKNAAMVEETNAATHNLSDVSANLAALVSRFSVSATRAHVERTYRAA